MAEPVMDLITPEEFTCFEGLSLLEKLLVSGQLVPALEIRKFFLEVEEFQFMKALFVARVMNLEHSYQFLCETDVNYMSSDDKCDYTFWDRLLYEAVEVNNPERLNWLLTLPITVLHYERPSITVAARLAAEHGNVEFLQLLVKVAILEKQRVDIESNINAYYEIDNVFEFDYISGNPPFSAAASNGKVECVRLLLDLGFSVDGPKRSVKTPLFFASVEGHLDVVKILLDAGADVNRRYFCRALHEVAMNGHAEIASLLIERGADFDVKDPWGRTPLQYAVMENREELVRLLIAAGADTATRANNGSTPLHSAASHGFTEIATMLIECGVNLEAKDNDGWTPLFFPVRWGEEAMVRLLVAAGADINAKSNDGRSVQDLAESDEIRALLCK